jgi:hypothetical protein
MVGFTNIFSASRRAVKLTACYGPLDLYKLNRLLEAKQKVGETHP